MMARSTIARRLAAAAALAALSFGFAAPPAASHGLETAENATGKTFTSNDGGGGGASTQGISWTG